ncbi:low-density lipoprotein receptor [Caloenas nicobarica]|uniref:low-density lipoprotein receptor n=1 Tax=Caloenas nicobarica TaxID=187106 RepID=UPI0032B783D6
MEPGAAPALLLLLLLVGATAAPGAGVPCPPGQFVCGDGSCVPSSWVCDGRPECPGGDDETPETCRSLSCSPSQFRCGGLGRCVPGSWRCDGHRDCGDGSDETGCPPPSCPGDHVPCGSNGTSCVAPAFLCDGDPDCPDASDEWPQNCNGTSGTPPGTPSGTLSGPPRRCPPLQFACGSGECVHGRWRCDGSDDCRDGSDEHGCAAPPPCPPGQFRCHGGRCIPAARRCDGDTDCADGSDEDGCPHESPCEGPAWFRCRSGECVPMGSVCDRRRDCRDWSDEPVKECGVNECLVGGGGCSHLCRDLPLGHECLCPGGLRLRTDGRTCEDASAPTDAAPSVTSITSVASITSDTSITSNSSVTGDTSNTSNTRDTSMTSNTSSASKASSNTTTGDAVGPGGGRTGPTVLAVLLPLGLLALAAAGARGLRQSWHRRGTNSISFHNPVFRKQHEDEEPLGGTRGASPAPRASP